jgi:myo-inositol-1(or 4)-monophosphatase
MGNKKPDYLNVAIEAARRSGEIILQNLGRLSKEDVTSKQASDYVTRVDRDSEQIIIKAIHNVFPNHHFLAEETIHEDLEKECLWIIDPLDGTTNYIHGYPQFSVSIALQYRGQVILGVIYDPLRKEIFAAEKSKGAFLNNNPIKVSMATLRDSLITTGFPFRKKDFIDLYLKLFRNIFLIIEEAGGIITDFRGRKEYLLTGNIVAGTPALHKEILKEVQEIFKGVIER